MSLHRSSFAVAALLVPFALSAAWAEPLPPLPTPPIAVNAPPPIFLQQARQAIAAGRTGEALEALERAETRVLDRIGQPPRASGPSTNPFVTGIATARRALQAGDRAGADRIIADLLSRTHVVYR
jgi:hypothetical protein